MEKLFSTPELARMWNVSESTVKRWADAGDLVCVKTPGGHRRFTVDAVHRFQRLQGFDAMGRLVATEDDVEAGPDALERALARPDAGALAELLLHASVAGDLPSARAVLTRSYLRGFVAVELYERLVTGTLHRIGENWMSGALTVADEHLATRTILDAMVALHPVMRRRPRNGKIAVVGCPEDELHEVAARCIALLLDQEGWHVAALGMNTPFFSFADAIERHRPRLVAISSTILDDLDRQSREYARLYAVARTAGAKVVVGGAGFRDPSVRARFPHDHHALSFRDFVRYAATLM